MAWCIFVEDILVKKIYTENVIFHFPVRFLFIYRFIFWFLELDRGDTSNVGHFVPLAYIENYMIKFFVKLPGQLTG